MDLERYEPAHLEGILRLCREQGWTTLPADPHRAQAAFAAPGAVTSVAVEGGEVVGFAHALTDGHIQAFLSFLLVAEGFRRRGVGRLLVNETLARSGAQRLDLSATDDSHDFYSSFPHDRWTAFRIHPAARD